MPEVPEPLAAIQIASSADTVMAQAESKWKSQSGEYKRKNMSSEREKPASIKKTSRFSRSRSSSSSTSSSRSSSWPSRNRSRSKFSKSKSRSRSRSRSRSVGSSEDDRRYDTGVRVGTRVHVGSLSTSTTLGELKTEFCRFGEILDAWMARSQPCFAFVVFRKRAQAIKAIQRMDGETLRDQRIRVTMARPRTKGTRPGAFNPHLRCYQCGKRGHFSRDCRTTQWNNQGGRRPMRRDYDRDYTNNNRDYTNNNRDYTNNNRDYTNNSRDYTNNNRDYINYRRDSPRPSRPSRRDSSSSSSSDSYKKD